MDKVNYPRGLIRYSTENAMARHLTKKEILGHVVRPRILLYSVILAAITLTTAWFIAHRIPLKVDVIRRGALARETDMGLIENTFTLRFMNTDEQAHRPTASGPPAWMAWKWAAPPKWTCRQPPPPPS